MIQYLLSLFTFIHEADKFSIFTTYLMPHSIEVNLYSNVLEPSSLYENNFLEIKFKLQDYYLTYDNSLGRIF